MGARRTYRAFGLALDSALELPIPSVPSPVPTAAVAIELEPTTQLLARWDGASSDPVWITHIDGRRYEMEHGRDGDHLMRWGDDALFHLSADGSTLTCAAPDPEDPAWRRCLLDTVLWSVSLLAGFEQLHAAAVDGAGGAIAIAGPSGAGKSSLAAELVRRGSSLVADDIVALSEGEGGFLAHPGPPVMNVPLRFAAAGGRRGLGAPIATLGDERWVAVDDAARRPRALTAICLLRRRADGPPVLERIPATVLELLPYTLGFPHLEGRLRRRFELFARVAATVPVYRLDAGILAPVAGIADAVDSLDTAGGELVEGAI